VVGKDADSNTLWVDQGDSPLLYSTRLDASQLNWIAGNPPADDFACTAKTRYRQADQRCHVESIDDNRWHIAFEARQRAVTPGQSVVFYDGERCLGGGVIEATDAAWGGLERAA
jgi:tRNA-specific 2-thiouridylase